MVVNLSGVRYVDILCMWLYLEKCMHISELNVAERFEENFTEVV